MIATPSRPTLKSTLKNSSSKRRSPKEVMVKSTKENGG